MNLKEILKSQDEFLKNGKFKNIEDRIKYLKVLKKEVKKNRDEILQALKEDIGKTGYEGFLTEYQIVTEELKYFIDNLYELLEEEYVGTSINIFPGRAKIIKKPYGKVLVQSPWNYPFQLALVPLIGGVAAGNTVLLKTSSKVPSTNKIIEKILKVLPQELVFFANNYSHEEILNEKYDFYFFTGSKRVGKIIYTKAAENLAPVVLELGGKSPCIVDKSANIKDAAKKIAWGKFLNAGQTCVAPDYVLVDKAVKEKLVKNLKTEIEKRYSNKENLAKIITKEKIEELSKLIEGRKDVFGGNFFVEERVFKPTLLTEAKVQDEIMKEEIFGPILPIIEYENLEDVVDYVDSKSTPLALYIFSKTDENINKVINELKFGGGCINDVIVHVSENKIPFGGMGESGLGSYHGMYSIDTFTHKTSIIETQSGISNSFRYPPYTNTKFNIAKNVLG
ncbi:aldehyde dehydrogenase family protein [Miniphocaeibacter massiliensis]|uniref:aldehyde dehydrogenase family protein n=1 Tax=Miniphocaeibacter massiliensis TaxID=2041841 RepID=UPI000C1C3171|nr:aldehyde dehydrogenase family protein [Miniphocaeibacter massiliensis]